MERIGVLTQNLIDSCSCSSMAETWSNKEGFWEKVWFEKKCEWVTRHGFVGGIPWQRTVWAESEGWLHTEHGEEVKETVGARRREIKDKEKDVRPRQERWSRCGECVLFIDTLLWTQHIKLLILRIILSGKYVYCWTITTNKTLELRDIHKPKQRDLYSHKANVFVVRHTLSLECMSRHLNPCLALIR